MTHEYTSHVVWTGNTGRGTESYRGYERTWDIAVPGKDVVHCSNDPLLGGDPSKMNPEDLLLSALASCHMLWYLHLASDEGIVVTSYADSPIGLGEVQPSGAGKFVSATLHPRISVRPGADLSRAEQIHHEIHTRCFIAQSVNFPVSYEPSFIVD